MDAVPQEWRGTAGANVWVVPFIAMVAERSGRNCLMTFRTASPVLFWTVREMAGAVNTIGTPASNGSRVRGDMDLDPRRVRRAGQGRSRSPVLGVIVSISCLVQLPKDPR